MTGKRDFPEQQEEEAAEGDGFVMPDDGDDDAYAIAEEGRRNKRLKLSYEKAEGERTIKGGVGDSVDELEQLITHSDDLYAKALELDARKRYYFAAQYFDKAIELHHVDAMLKLAKYYEIGRGVEKDKQRAVQVYKHALKHGSEEAMFLVAQLLEKMGESERAKEYYEEGADSGCEKCTARLTTWGQPPPPRPPTPVVLNSPVLPPPPSPQMQPVPQKPPPCFQAAMDLYHGLNGVAMDRCAGVDHLFECVSESGVGGGKAKIFLSIMAKRGVSEVSSRSSELIVWYNDFLNARPSFDYWDELEEMIVQPKRRLCSFYNGGGVSGVCTGNEASFRKANKKCEYKFVFKWDKSMLSIIPVEIGMCSKLEILVCYKNQLAELPAELGQCMALEELSCYNNKLTTLPKELGNCRAMQKLCCYNNKLTYLPDELGQCLALKKLYCYSNQLTALPSSLGKCRMLKKLCCSINQLTYLPVELGQCTELEKLSVSYNELTALPKELGQCTALQELYCYYNQLTALPKELGQCTRLKILYCYNNMLTSLPKELGRCTGLTVLYCYSNDLTALPKELGRCTALQKLYCTDNQLKTLPKELGQCTLHELSCYNNKITIIPKSIEDIKGVTIHK